jgi:G3E family GTPase
MKPVPTTVITGALGVGKTTAVLALLRHAPQGERWAVLVNEFGEVGIDGGVIEESGFAVREIPGGCICCTAGVALQVSLVRLLREVKPERLLIEPTGLAHPASVIDTLRRPGLREAILRRATLTLVDPRHLSDPRMRQSPSWQDQITAADLLVATKTDLCSEEQIAEFRRFASELWPPPIAVHEVAHGALDPAWLDLDPSPTARPTLPEPHAHGHPIDAPSEARAYRSEGPDGVETCGWIWPDSVVFDQGTLREVLQRLVRPGPLLPGGVRRAKGLFRTPGAWVLVQADPDAVRFTPTGWRRDSRLEILAPTTPRPDWFTVDSALKSAIRA